ncbi:tetratricopeptide repeat protein [Vibrio splendidus]|uniref:tetratricopeptide repeat protein n=1 Tax=Vibrio splendidus TaxID=29497 RepID=UPI000D373F58|nr:tetratricopeptide repeat protein [Vibrio splendidus]PTP79018.1 hypothetical protein CWO00_07265 [Vibrio splendidus]
MHNRIIGGDNSLNIQALRDVNINIDPEVIEVLLNSTLDDLFKKLSESDDKLKNEIVRLIRNGNQDEARKVLKKLVKGVSEKFSDDCLDFANLFMILEPNKANEFYEKSLSIDPNNHDAINCYAIYLMGCGQLDKAEKLFSSSLSIKSLSNHQREAINGNLGVLYKNSGQWNKAIDFLSAALRLSRLEQSYIGTVKHLNNLGSVYINTEDYKSSHIYLKESLSKLDVIIELEVKPETKNEYKIVKTNILTNMSIRLRHLYIKDNDKSHLSNAINILNQAIDISEILDRKQEMSRHYGNLSNIYRQLEDKKECKKFIRKSLSLSKEIGDHRGEVCGLLNLGLAFYDEKNFSDAIKALNEGLVKESNSYPKLRANIFCSLAYVYKDINNQKKMNENAIKAKELYEELGLTDSLAVVQRDFIEI